MEGDQSRYSILEKRINEILENFSFSVDPLNPPTEKQEDYIRAMVVLCHAEFEDYIEQLACMLIEEGKNRWVSEGIANKNIASLFMNTEKMKNDPQMRPMNTTSFAMKTISDFSNIVKNGNHGIKSKNIEDMYKPLGYDIDKFNQDFLNELDAFGLERGKIAHTSSYRTTSKLDLRTEVDKIKRVLRGIKDFEDEVIQKSGSLNEKNYV
ncbi:HEPN domain-containing protein [Lachnospira multipara]|uniref:RiboL-PSP-HEPN domain-containing protein n=1 Tax=Lachnospira multipara TaxID=28051 RepID=A0A1H5S316_9FIRM|nr:HEPN domain-containing protein [Lachnospira multipara]SEF44989.1 hypothetical protein SAMN05216537_10241 [Lachnospira multipara]